MQFTEKWIQRFMDVLDGNLDEATRKKVMMASGKACFLAWIKETGQQIRPRTLEEFKKHVAERARDNSIRFDGQTIYFQYTSAAETGLPSAEGACLCSLVEHRPAGFSRTYCYCSVGYVKQMYDLMLTQPVEVELQEAVLWGGKRCRFKITLA